MFPMAVDKRRIYEAITLSVLLLLAGAYYRAMTIKTGGGGMGFITGGWDAPVVTPTPPNDVRLYCLQRNGSVMNENCTLPDGTSCVLLEFFLERCPPKIANESDPAEAYCIAQGGTLSVVRYSDHRVETICDIGGGKSCVASEYLAGTCPRTVVIPNGPEVVLCEERGGTLRVETFINLSQTGFCDFSDGSTCELRELSAGRCP